MCFDTMSVEDIASLAGRKHTISGVHVSPGSAETLAMRGEITKFNHYSIAYFLGNMCAIKLPTLVDVR